MEFRGTFIKGVFTPYATSAFAVMASRFEKSKTVVQAKFNKEGHVRSRAQNDRYWSLIVPAFSEWSGYPNLPDDPSVSEEKKKDFAHNVLKALLVKKEFKLPDGQVVTYVPSTTELTTAEMAKLQDDAEAFLNQHEIYLPAKES